MSGRNYDPRRTELLLQRYVDGELRASERAELEAMLESDAKLRSELDAMQAMRGLFDDARRENKPPPLGLDFADRVWARAQDEVRAASASTPPLVPMLKRASLIAASILFLLGAALWTMPTERASELGASPQAKRALLRELEARRQALRQAERRRATASDQAQQDDKAGDAGQPFEDGQAAEARQRRKADAEPAKPDSAKRRR